MSLHILVRNNFRKGTNNQHACKADYLKLLQRMHRRERHFHLIVMPSVHWYCWPYALPQEEHMACKNVKWCCTSTAICVQQGANDLVQVILVPSHHLCSRKFRMVYPPDTRIVMETSVVVMVDLIPRTINWNMCINYPVYMPIIPSFLIILRIAWRLVLCSLALPPSPTKYNRTQFRRVRSCP